MVLGQVQWSRVYWPGLQVADLCLYLCLFFCLYLYLCFYLYLHATLGHSLLMFMWRKCYLLGLIWSEIKQLWDVGLKEYISDMWVWITISKDRSSDNCYTHRQLKVECGGLHHKLSLRGHHWTQNRGLYWGFPYFTWSKSEVKERERNVFIKWRKT